MIKKASITFVLLILLAAGGWYYFTHHFNLLGNCSTEVVITISSPSRTHAAEQHVQNCGTTTDFSTHINIDEISVATIKGRHIDDVKVVWVDDAKIKITYNGNKDLITDHTSNYKGIVIELEVNGEIME